MSFAHVTRDETVVDQVTGVAYHGGELLIGREVSERGQFAKCTHRVAFDIDRHRHDFAVPEAERDVRLERRRPEDDLALPEKRRRTPFDRVLDSSLGRVNDLVDVSRDRLSKGCTTDKIRIDFARVVSPDRLFGRCGTFPRARSGHDPPRLCAGMLAVLEHLFAVDEHMAHADSILLRPGERRHIGNCCGIEDGKVGIVARFERPTLDKA